MRQRLVLIAAVGLLGSACAAIHVPASGVASGARPASPSQAPPNATPNPTDISLSAPSTNVVWALSGYNRLYRSMDGGAQWVQRFVFAGPFRSMSFIDEHEGWVLDSGSTTQCPEGSALLWHTLDAGATWQQLPANGIGASQCKHGMWFFDAQHGIVTASDPDHRPTIYRTSDGGRNWAASTLQDPAYFKSGPGGFTLQVEWVKQLGSTLYLEAFGSQGDPNLPHDNQFVLKSTDGGASWSLVTKVSSPAVVMVTEARWLDLAIPGQSFESVNGGQQFHQYASDFNADAPSGSRFVFADALVGYAVGVGLLQRTVDGGAHWVRIQSPGKPMTSASPTPGAAIPMPTTAILSAPSGNVVWAFVAGQYLFRSTDQGKTWQQRNWAPYSGGGGDPVITFVDDTNGWAMFPGVPATSCSTQGAQVWRTTDGANSWQLVASAVYGQVSPNAFAFEQCKDTIAFADAQHGFLAAGDTINAATIYRTSDGGVTWSPSTLPDPRANPVNGPAMRVISIKSFPGTVLVSASDGTSAFLFRSIDGGAGWTFLGTPPAATTDISFLTPTHWLMVQAGSETIDAGKSWHAFSTDYSDAAGVASTFVFADEKVGYGTVRGGVHRTLDGGAHWEMIKTSWP